MRSKYCFRPEDRSSAVFWFDSAYSCATTEHPEDLFTLYVMRVQKRKWANLRGLQFFSLKNGFAILWTVFRLQKSPDFFVAVRLVCFFPLFLETKRWPHSKTRKAVLSKQLFVPKRGKKKCSHFFLFVNHLNQRNLPPATLVSKEIGTESRSSFFQKSSESWLAKVFFIRRTAFYPTCDYVRVPFEFSQETWMISWSSWSVLYFFPRSLLETH